KELRRALPRPAEEEDRRQERDDDRGRDDRPVEAGQMHRRSRFVVILNAATCPPKLERRRKNLLFSTRGQILRRLLLRMTTSPLSDGLEARVVPGGHSADDVGDARESLL